MPLVPWATVADLPATRPTLPGGDEQYEALLVSASEVLYALTGRRIAGLRERAVELYPPCHCGRHRRWTPEALLPDGGTVYGGSLGAPVVGYLDLIEYGLPLWGCHSHTVRLPNRGVVALTGVATAARVLLDPASYRIDRGGYLRRAPGVDHDAAPLPRCRRPLLIRYRFGRDPGPAGRQHAVDLAVALAQATIDPDSSPLPGTVQQIVRQGVTMRQQTASDVVKEGGTGLTAVDYWVSSVNPGKASRPSRSWSPDTDAPYYPIELEEFPS